VKQARREAPRQWIGVRVQSLLARTHPLASAEHQRKLLAELRLPLAFEQALARSDLHPLRPTGIEVFQMNLGKLCNQTCRHCHVDAGPDRREVMPDDVLEACLRAFEASGIQKLDITGGAPELHPQFRALVERARQLGRHVMDRCNLTILMLPAHADLAEFLAAQKVEIIASLPSPNLRQTDAQRGSGVFEKSIAALQRLNAIGYGRDPELRSYW
jgi:radical SAM/Cys-rich protein